MKEVSLISPAKVGGERRRAGATVLVDAATLAQLIAAGAVRADADHDHDATPSVRTEAQVLAFTQAEFDAAVQAAAAALAGQAFDGALGKLEAEAREIAAAAEVVEAEKAALLARAIEAEAQRDMLQDRVLELQGQLSAATAAAGQAVAADGRRPATSGAAALDQPDTPEPSETAAKTAPKKGAAAKTKG